MMKHHEGKLRRTTDDIIIMITDDEEMFRKKFITQKCDSDEWKCTICKKITKDKPFPHPALRVSICFDCFKSYQDAIFLTNKDGTDKNCRWCAKQTKKYHCSRCTVVFCKSCLEHNFSAEFVRNSVVNNSNWNCFICSPKPLWRLRVACYKLLENNMSAKSDDIVIDLLSQDSQENSLPCSEQAFPNSDNHVDQFSSEILSPNVESDREIQNNNNKESIEQEMSVAQKNSLIEVLQETETDFKLFIELFNKRVGQITNKIHCGNLTSIAQAEKLVNKVSILCDKAVENIHHVSKNNQSRFEKWRNSVEKEQIEEICDKTPPKVKKEPKSKTERKNNKTKFNLSLKQTPEDDKKSSDSEDTMEYLEQIKSKLPEDRISPAKSFIFPESQKSEVKISTSVKRKPKQKSPNSSPDIAKKKLAVEGTQTETSSNLSDLLKLENSNEVYQESVQIKSEEDASSDETIIRDSALGEQELLARIREDFTATPSSYITIENYLCEKSGELCQSYKRGDDSIEDSPTCSINEESNFAFSEDNSDRTEEYDWSSDLVDLTKTQDQETVTIKEKESELSQISSIKNEEDSTEENFKLVLESEEMSQESQMTEKLQQQTKAAKTIEDSSETIENKQESDSETTDSECLREAALRALKSSSSSSSLDFSFSGTDSDESYYREIERKKAEENKNINGSGYVRELDIAAELVKLQRNNQNETDTEDLDSSDSDEYVEGISDTSFSESENDSSDSNRDQKLHLKPIVMLDSDIKLTLKPVVKLLKLDYEKYLEDKLLQSNSDDTDSDEEINRLLNLSTLKRRNRVLSTDSSDLTEARRKRIKKRPRKSSKDSESSSLDSDGSVKTEPTSDEFIFDLTQRTDKDYVPNVGDDLLNDSLSDDTTSDDDVVEVKEDKNKQKKQDVENLVTDEEDAEKSPKEDDEKAKWRKDKLLTKKLTLTNSDSETTNDSTANELLKKEEERYLKNMEKKQTSRRRSVESISSSGTDDDDAIILSDDDAAESDNSDCQIVTSKRKHESDEESPAGKSKKGRRNIREVLKDSELQAETQKADKEEVQRKERLSIKQKAIDSVLSESQLSQETVGLVLDVDEDKKEPIVTVHHALVPKLKEHQKKGIQFMWDVCFESVAELKRSKGAGCILAHCMGLGKTMQVVVLAHTLLTHSQTNVKHILIVCPLSTVFNWRDEFEKTLSVCKDITLQIPIFDIRPDRQKTFNNRMFEIKRWRSLGGVLMLGYESFQSLVNEKNLSKTSEDFRKLMLESLIDPGPSLVVCDEGHMLKNGKTLRFSSLSQIKTMRRIILTGTPLQNNLIEYYHMVNFVKPHLLGTIDEYKNRFVNPISNGQYEDSSNADIHLMKKRSHVLHKKLETTVQRYEESELIPYLPPKQDYVLYVQLTPLQIVLYEHYLQLLDINTKKLFKNYHALQNIWTHPALLKIKLDKRKEPAPKVQQKRYDEDFVQALDPDSEDTTGLETDWFKDLLPEDILTNVSYGVKMDVLFSIIKECEAVKEKLLVFSSSIDELDLIETFLKNRNGENWMKGIDYYRMDGTVAPERRMKYCKDFNNEQNPRSRLFLVSHKVGGLGLNLTAASRVVLMDVSWNPAYDIQSVFRIYRFGQTKTCYIYRFVSMGTMEEVVYSRAVTKLAVSCRVVDEHQIKRHFNSDDLQRMYRLIKDFGEPPIPTLPSDRLLAKLWENHKPLLYKFCDHQSLLENLAHEELNEEEMKLAWEEFGKEIEAEKIAKDTVINRYINIPQPPNNQSGPLPQQKYAIPIPVGRPDFAPNPLYRYKRPNRLPSSDELQRLDPSKYVHFNRLPLENRRAFYRQQGANPYVFNNPMASTSTNLYPMPSTSANPPASTSGFPVASTSSAVFPAVSTSINPNFSVGAPRTKEVLTPNRNYNQTLNLSADNNGIRNSVNQSNLPANANGIQNNSTGSVIIEVPNNKLYKNGVDGKSKIRKMGNDMHDYQMLNSYVQTGIVLPKSNGEKENILQNRIQNLNKNGVSVVSEMKSNQNLTSLGQNHPPN